MPLVALTVLASLASITSSQEVPARVTYKRTSADVNKKASDLVAQFFTKLGATMPSDDVVICGPRLWYAIKGSANKTLRSAKDVKFLVPDTSTGEVQEL